MFLRPAFALLVAVPLLVVSTAGLAARQEQEKPKVPKDSLLVNVTGCLKGRVIRAEDVRQPDTVSGMTVRNHAFRLSGKKDVMASVKEYDGQRVEISGLIKKSALIEPGVKFKGGRVVIGGGSPTSNSTMPDPADNVVVLDAMTVQSLGGSCSSQR